jgi:hypothetical protein
VIQIGKEKDQKIVISKHHICGVIDWGIDESLIGSTRIESEVDERLILPVPDAERGREEGGSASGQ